MSKRFPGGPGDDAVVLDSIDLAVEDKSFVSIVRRSGCGKTTLLNILAGLETPSAGEVRIDGHPVRGPGQGQGVVFQQHALFPWLTAAGNVAFGCRDPALSKSDRAERAADLLRLVGLEDAAAKYPREMSGGMQQRVAIARALALDPPPDGRALRRARRIDAHRDAAGTAADLVGPAQDRGVRDPFDQRGADPVRSHHRPGPRPGSGEARP